MLTHIDLFSGIGGFALACKWAGIETVQFVEIDPFCHKVLKKNFPGVPIHDDIKTFTNTEFTRTIRQEENQSNGNDREKIFAHRIQSAEGIVFGGNDRTDEPCRPFLITGGFPCQPFSCAGKRKGDRDDRFLWPQMLRVIKEFQPTWVIGENVAGIASMVLTDNGIEMGDNDAETQEGDRTNVLVRCITDLESIGYDVQAFCIPACSLGAPHRRDRVWIVGNCISRSAEVIDTRTMERKDGETESEREAEIQNAITYTDSNATDARCVRPEKPELQPEGGKQCNQWDEPWLEVATRLCRVDDGVSDRVHRLKALGNAIVPQVAYQIIRAIVEIHNGDSNPHTYQQAQTILSGGGREDTKEDQNQQP